MRSQQTHLYGMCARAALFFAAFVAASTILACSSVYLAATSGSEEDPGRQTMQDISSQVRCSQGRTGKVGGSMQAGPQCPHARDDCRPKRSSLGSGRGRRGRSRQSLFARTTIAKGKSQRNNRLDARARVPARPSTTGTSSPIQDFQVHSSV